MLTRVLILFSCALLACFTAPGPAPAATTGVEPAATRTFSTFLGGSSGDYATAIASDSQGNTYIAGYTLSEDFPVTSGAYQVGGYSPGFVSKYAADGTLVFTALIGTGDEEGMEPRGLTVDSAGQVSLTGYTTSPNLPTTAGAFDRDHNGNKDAFVLTLAPDGSSVVYGTYLGTAEDDFGNAIAVDSQGRIVVGGSIGAVADALLVRLSADGAQLEYARAFNGSFEDVVNAVAVDVAGNVYATGSTRSQDFFTTPGAYDRIRDEGAIAVLDRDAFVLKLDPSGQPVYSTFLGAVGDDIGRGIAVDAVGNAVVVGSTGSQGSTAPPLAPFPTTAGAYQRIYAGGISDTFVTMLNATGSALVFSTLLGGNRQDDARGVALDQTGQIVLAGRTDSVSFPIVGGLPDQPGQHEFCAMGFVSALDPQGRTMAFSSLLGGAHQAVGAGCGDYATGVATQPGGRMLVAGVTSADDFPVALPVQGHGGGIDAFVSHIHVASPPRTPLRPVAYLPLLRR